MFLKQPKNIVDVKFDMESCINDAIDDCKFTIQHIDNVIPELEDLVLNGDKREKRLMPDLIKNLKSERKKHEDFLKYLPALLPFCETTLDEFTNDRIF